MSSLLSWVEEHGKELQRRVRLELRIEVGAAQLKGGSLQCGCRHIDSYIVMGVAPCLWRRACHEAACAARL
jgi:hypothetical protein